MNQDGAIGFAPDGFGLDAFRREALAELGLQPYLLAGAGCPPAVPQGATAGAIPPALLQALARAAGCDPRTVAALPGVESACAGPAGKRGLWPRLRRLRADRR